MLLLALVHAQNGPTVGVGEEGRGENGTQGFITTMFPKKLFSTTHALETILCTQQLQQPCVIPHLSRRGPSASGGCHG